MKRETTKMGKLGGPNQKAVAAAEKKAAAKAVKDAARAAEAGRAAAADWAVGSNARGAARAESAAAKADEAASKRREKAALLAAEEEAMGSGKAVKPKVNPKLAKRGGKKNKKDDLSLLEDSLVSAADKKTKEKKKLERIKRENEAKAAAEKQRKAKQEEGAKDPLLANTDAMIGDMGGDDGGGGDGAPTPAVGRAANVASMSNLHATGLDSALSALSVGGGGAADEHPEKRRKAAYKAYEERMLVELKSTMPGLKRQQYLDKIFQSWKKSPENPMNQQQS